MFFQPRTLTVRGGAGIDGWNNSVSPFILVSSVIVVVLFVQSCLTLCDSKDCNPRSSSVHGILQAKILECVAIPFSRRSS